MGRAVFLVFVLIFMSCCTSLADVITLRDGSIFEGNVIKETEEGKTFGVGYGTVFIYFAHLISIENRTLRDDEMAKLISFKTDRYDVTNEAESFTPFEEGVADEYYALREKNPDMPSDSLERLVAERFNLPPIIVNIILDKDMWFWFSIFE